MCIRDREGSGPYTGSPFDVVKSPIKAASGWTIAPENAKEFTLLLGGGLLRRPCLILADASGKYDRVAIYLSLIHI